MLLIQRNLFLAVPSHVAGERVKKLIWLLTLCHPRDCCRLLGSSFHAVVLINQLECGFGRLFGFEIGFSVEVRSLYEDVALLMGTAQDHDVCRHIFVLPDDHHAANPQVLPLGFDATGRACLPLDFQSKSIVLLSIRLVPSPVLERVLERIQEHDEGHREEDCWHPSGGRHLWQQLQDRQEEEVTVCRLGKLLQQILGDEVQQSVVGSDDLVVADDQILCLECQTSRLSPCWTCCHLRNARVLRSFKDLSERETGQKAGSDTQQGPAPRG
mmetsp:Transcript_7017/g.11142  ORF Transcript_7017/g.11142 Transcript_7017/m.11142 type:complete len:270 (+) Transcript_7017:3011-3820(+)